MMAFQTFATTLVLVAAACAQTPPGFSPSCDRNLGVTFSNHTTVHPGSVFPYSEVFIAIPSISAELVDVHRRYAVFLIDPDAIEGGNLTPILHWYQPDLSLEPHRHRLFNDTQNGASYVGPNPPPGPGHRYVLLLFAQAADYRFPECFSSIIPPTLAAREGFNLEQFIKVANFGQPVAATWFRVVSPQAATSTQVATATSLSSADCPQSTAN